MTELKLISENYSVNKIEGNIKFEGHFMFENNLIKNFNVMVTKDDNIEGNISYNEDNERTSYTFNVMMMDIQYMVILDSCIKEIKEQLIKQ